MNQAKFSWTKKQENFGEWFSLKHFLGPCLWPGQVEPMATCCGWKATLAALSSDVRPAEWGSREHFVIFLPRRMPCFHFNSLAAENKPAMVLGGVGRKQGRGEDLWDITRALCSDLLCGCLLPPYCITLGTPLTSGCNLSSSVRWGQWCHLPAGVWDGPMSFLR